MSPIGNYRHHATKDPFPIREAAFASLKAPLRPVRAPVDPTDASETVRLRAAEEFSSTVVVKPPLARLEARDYRVYAATTDAFARPAAQP
jgi:hypothetical protein